MATTNLGDTVKVGDIHLRVVRVINKSLTLYEGPKRPYIVEESYLELKGSDGSIEFIQLDKQELPYTGASSVIKALEPPNFQQPEKEDEEV